MTSLEAYYKFLIKINKGNTQSNITCDIPQFVLLYNENQRKYVGQRVPANNSDDVNNIQNIIKTINPVKIATKDEYVAFELPKDWFATTDGYIFATKGNCKKQKINIRQIKSDNRRLLYFDENNAPSFEFEWTFFVVESDQLKVFKKDFQIDNLTVSYYREPKEIDVEGYIKLDGSNSVNIDPEFNDLTVEEILNEASLDFMRNWENQIGFQLNKDRVTNLKQ